MSTKARRSVGEARKPLAAPRAGLLSAGDSVEVTRARRARAFILLAGRPLREPVVQYGPFVMNTREEIEQAIEDYQSGALARVRRGSGARASPAFSFPAPEGSRGVLAKTRRTPRRRRAGGPTA